MPPRSLLYTVLLLSLLLVTVFSQTPSKKTKRTLKKKIKPDETAKDLCIYDFIAMDYEDPHVTLQTQTNCYSLIQNYTSKILSFDRDLQCYLHPSNFYIHKANNTISRCGQALRLVGPSQKQFICYVAGTMELSAPDLNKDLQTRIIGIQRHNLNYLTAGLTGAVSYISQVTFSPEVPVLGVTPSIHVVQRTEKSVSLQVINSNTIVEAVEVIDGNQTTQYPLRRDGLFVVDISKGPVATLRLLSDSHEKVSLLCDFSKGDVFVSDFHFSARTPQKCRFLVDDVVYQEHTRTSLPSVLKWQIWQGTVSGSGSQIPESEREVYIKKSDYYEKEA
ncbi:hypothetical protein EIN_462220, partial [Entamoeba invadens IP1]